MQISNDGAKKFYERHGFEEVGVHENYYKKIVPHDAWILEKVVHTWSRELNIHHYIVLESYIKGK